MPDDMDEALTSALSAIASPVRLRLMRELRRPKPVGEIEVWSEHGERPRPLSRQSVRKHLDQLLAQGIVVHTIGEGGRDEYVLNHQAVFVLAEGVRSLARLRPLIEAPTPTAKREIPESAEVRPCLILVRGLEEGRRFDLAPKAHPRSEEWVIGRAREAEISLDYDPYVSRAHARVTWTGEGHAIRPIEGCFNGTAVNLRRLPEGGDRPLQDGDLIGVGASLLVYWS